jgi:hypothetical protein
MAMPRFNRVFIFDSSWTQKCLDRTAPHPSTSIEAALESYRQGRIVGAKRAREIIDAAVGR